MVDLFVGGVDDLKGEVVCFVAFIDQLRGQKRIDCTSKRLILSSSSVVLVVVDEGGGRMEWKSWEEDTLSGQQGSRSKRVSS